MLAHSKQLKILVTNVFKWNYFWNVFLFYYLYLVYTINRTNFVYTYTVQNLEKEHLLNKNPIECLFNTYTTKQLYL